MNDNFYRAFENRHRGSRELIQERLNVYLPFIKPLLATLPDATAIDLGCGRGEWLELLKNIGFRPMGIDLDQGMLSACLELNLPVVEGDALAYLSGLPDSSQVIVSAFHLVEHISFEQLKTLIVEALRVLKPGGLLIMETPNPENIVVATCDFYLDPTHIRPIPSELLCFVAEHVGFARVKTLRLQELKSLVEKRDVNLLDVFSGASPDYAIVAQKNADNKFLELTKDPFCSNYGLSSEDLILRWDKRFEVLVNKIQQVEAKAEQVEAKAEQAEAKAEQAVAKAVQAETMAAQFHYQLQAVYASSSWKITRPLRGIKRLLSGDKNVLRQLNNEIKLKAKLLVRLVVVRTIRCVNARPKLAFCLKRVVARLPWLKQCLARILLNAQGTTIRQFDNSSIPSNIKHMTPRARQIYQDLQQAIEKNKQRNNK